VSVVTLLTTKLCCSRYNTTPTNKKLKNNEIKQTKRFFWKNRIYAIANCGIWPAFAKTGTGRMRLEMIFDDTLYV
jgi:hypothetical protein